MLSADICATIFEYSASIADFIEDDNAEGIRVVLQLGARLPDYAFYLALNEQKADVLQCVLENGASYTQSGIDEAMMFCSGYSLEIIKMLVQKCNARHLYSALADCAYYGNLPAVRYFIEELGLTMSTSLFANAWNDLDVLAYLIEKNCPPDHDTIYRLINYGHLPLLTRLAENGARFTQEMLEFARDIYARADVIQLISNHL